MAEDPPRSFVGTSYSWQNDRMPHGSYSLGGADRVLHMLRLRCEACGRSGQYRIDRLIERYGRDIALHELAQCRGAATWPSRAKSSMSIRSTEREHARSRGRVLVSAVPGASSRIYESIGLALLAGGRFALGP